MKREPRVIVRFNDGEYETDPLPESRARRVALRGVGEFGKFNGGHAELVDPASGEAYETLMEV